MKATRWVFGALAGLSVLVMGLSASGVDLVGNEERSRGSAGITATGADFADPPYKPMSDGVHIGGVDLASHDRHLYLTGITARGAD